MAKQWKRSLSGDDVQAEAEDALEKDIANLSPASNSVAANLDGGVAAVDWASKTPNIEAGGTTTADNTDLVSVSGSGYLISIYGGATNSNNKIRVDIDGVTEVDIQVKEFGGLQTGGTTYDYSYTTVLLHRFDSSFAVGSSDATDEISSGVSYVLD